uniref:BTB domain-containing protein n=1 Tax=Zooxanthella nutricula TaxID=1333877 RepID=A0A7S2HDZ9_9DINO
MDPDQAAASPPKRARFSIEPDVEVEVEGEAIPVHSYVLMSQSSVFHQMLSGGMCEAASGRMSLPGKNKEEFKEFLRHFECPGIGDPPEIEPEVAKWLVGWADEYDVPLLKTRCEKALVENSRGANHWDNLEIATKFKLEELRRESVLNIAMDVFPHRHRLLEILKQPPLSSDSDSDDPETRDDAVATEGAGGTAAGGAAVADPAAKEDEEDKEPHPHDVFKKCVLPSLYRAVFLEQPDIAELPDALSIEHLWPIVVRALELADGWSDLEEAHQAALRAVELEKHVSKPIPMSFGNTKVTLRDIHSKCKDAAASSQLQVDEVVQALRRRGCVKKQGQHFYYDPNKDLPASRRRGRFAHILSG